MADAEHFITLALESWRRFSADFGDKMQSYGLTVAQALMIREIGIHKRTRLISEAATATVEALSEEDLEALKNIVSKMKNGYVQP